MLVVTATGRARSPHTSTPPEVDPIGMRRVLHEVVNGLAGAHQVCQLLLTRPDMTDRTRELSQLGLTGIESALDSLRSLQEHLRSGVELPAKK